MLLATGDLNSDAYAHFVLTGSLLAGVVCGLWPLRTGLRLDRPITGGIGLFVCLPCGFLFGCLCGLPVAFAFHLLIEALGRPNPPGDDFPDTPFDPYANGKRTF